MNKRKDTANVPFLLLYNLYPEGVEGASGKSPFTALQRGIIW